MQPDQKKAIILFLNALYSLATENQEGYFCVLTKQENHPAKQKFFSINKISQAVDYIVRMNQHSNNVYISLNPLKTPKRTKENVIDLTRLIFLDFDAPEPYSNFIRDYPHPIVIQTSQNKYQAIIILSEPIHKYKAELISKALSYKYYADKTFDCTRVIRCPYTLNWKYQPPFLSKIIKNKYKLYQPEIFENLIPQQQNYYEFPDLDASHINTDSIDKSKIEKATEIYQKILKNTPLKPNLMEKDYSRADISFLIYCLSNHQFSIQEAATLLKTISPDLQKRKCSSVDKYVSLTLSKALSYIQQNNSIKNK